MQNLNLDFFFQAANEVFTEMGYHLSILPVHEVNNEIIELMASIGITGDFKGFIILKSSMQSAKNFVTQLLANLEMPAEEKDFGQFHKEAFGEALNQLSGRSTMLLEGQGIHCDITPPTFITGKNIFTNTMQFDHSLSRYLSGDFGIFTLYVGVKKQKTG